MRIVHLPVDLGGHASGLAAAQRALGHEAEAVSLAWSELGFNADRSLDAPQGTSGRLRRREGARWRLLWETLVQADVIHCHFGQTALSVRPYPLLDPTAPGSRWGERLRQLYARLFWLRDLPLWRSAGKTVAMTFYGDDIRSIAGSVERNAWSHLAIPSVAGPLLPREALRGELLRAVERHVPLVYATNPDLLETLPTRARLLGYTHCDPRRIAPAPWPEAWEELAIVHMPTNRAVKGTDILVEAVETLRAEGCPIRLTLVEGRSNAEAVAAIARHHLLFDQLRVGWYGGVAVEAMMLGRPVAAFLHPRDMALAPPALAAELPILPVTVDGCIGTLRALAATPREALALRGAQSRAFAERWHDPKLIAQGVIDDYRSAGAPA